MWPQFCEAGGKDKLGVLSIIDTRPVVIGAGFWTRVLARLIDMAYGYVIGLLAGIIAVLILAALQALSLADPGWGRRMTGEGFVALAAGLLGALLYETACEGIYGATLGKLLCGLRVLAQDRSPCRLKPALIRSLGYLVDALVFGLVAYIEMAKTEMMQRHGDRWAGTVVVRNSQVPNESKRSASRLLLALLCGSMLWAVLLSAVMVWSARLERPGFMPTTRAGRAESLTRVSVIPE